MHKCEDDYVEQIKNNFNIRWNANGNNCKKFRSKFNINDISGESLCINKK